MVEWRDWGAFCADTLDTKPMIVGANCITLDELAYEATVLLLAYAPITIEAQIPVFTEWVVNGSSWNTKLQKKNSLNKQKGL